MNMKFDGQQTDERILYEIAPAPITKILAILRVISLVVFFYLMILLIATQVPDEIMQPIKLGGALLSALAFVLGIWWNESYYQKSRAYITDRRVMRLEMVSPFFLAKRALFWTETMKAKAYTPNLLWRMLGIGTVEIEPQLADHESVRITDTLLFEDIANYIDKILFTCKSKPADIASIKPFVPKPRGHRD